jgi:hypothetical protein
MMKKLFRDNPALLAVILAALAFLVGTGVRYWFYEPDIFGAICYADKPWWCVFRSFIAVASKFNVFGYVGLLLTALAAWRIYIGKPMHGLAYAAIIIGGAGMILYDATVSAPAVLIATILLVRAPERRSL